MLYVAILCYCLRVFNRLTASQFLRGWLGHEAGESLIICNGWPHSSWQPFVFATAFVLQLLHQCQGTLASSGGPQSFLQISIQLAYLEFCNFNMFVQKGWDVLLFGLFGNFLPTSYINFPKGLKHLQRSFNLSLPRFNGDISFAMGFTAKHHRSSGESLAILVEFSQVCLFRARVAHWDYPWHRRPGLSWKPPKSDWTWKWFLNVPLENETSLQSNPFLKFHGFITVAVNIGETFDYKSYVLALVHQVAKAENLQGDRVPPWPPSHPLSLGDLLHLIPVADLLKSVPSEWKDRRKMFLHMEHLEELRI